MDHIRGGGGAQRSHGLLLRQGRGSGGNDDFLGAGLVAGSDLDLGYAFELGERGGDVVLAAGADHAGHFSHIADRIPREEGKGEKREEGESKSRACHGRQGLESIYARLSASHSKFVQG